jgi:hypothetical protein
LSHEKAFLRVRPSSRAGEDKKTEGDEPVMTKRKGLDGKRYALRIMFCRRSRAGWCSFNSYLHPDASAAALDANPKISILHD